MSATDVSPSPPALILNAWVDESVWVNGSAGTYLLGATVCDVGACAPYRSTLRSLRQGKSIRLHWREEKDSRKPQIAAAIGHRPVTTFVVVGRPMAARKQERARRICMETLFPLLTRQDVTLINIERRTDSQDAQDRKMVAALRRSRALPPHVQVTWTQPSTEPMLWIPDAVLGAVGAARRSKPQSMWLAHMQVHHEVLTYDVALR